MVFVSGKISIQRTWASFGFADFLCLNKSYSLVSEKEVVHEWNSGA